MKKNNINNKLYKFDITTFCSYTSGVEWDKQKSQKNLEKHGLDFICANEIFDGFYLEKQDTRIDYGEDRHMVLGALNGREVVMIYTMRDTKKRIISLRKANEREQKIYQQERLKALGCDD
ncbi:MAG: BrnT family toxin [Gammaproteobacteria bacterium]